MPSFMAAPAESRAMAEPGYVSVRRPSHSPFRVLPDDLLSGPAEGYDLSLMCSIARDGLMTPISVQPVEGHRFEVKDGHKRLAAIRMLVRINKLAFDKIRGLQRPAKDVFALLLCCIHADQSPKSPRREATPLVELADG